MQRVDGVIYFPGNEWLGILEMSGRREEERREVEKTTWVTSVESA